MQNAKIAAIENEQLKTGIPDFRVGAMRIGPGCEASGTQLPDREAQVGAW